MVTIARVAQTMQSVLGEIANELGRETGFIKRERKFSGAKFVQTLVFGWLANGKASLGEMNQAAAAIGLEVSEQGLAKRFTAEAATFMEAQLQATIGALLAGEPASVAVLKRFNGVYIRDSTVLGLPSTLVGLWLGCGNSQGETAALKIQVEWELNTGALTDIALRPGREHDSQALRACAQLPVGSLNIRDLGYFKLNQLAKEQQNGQFWLSRYKMGTTLLDESGQRFKIGEWLQHLGSNTMSGQRAVSLGVNHQIPCRLVVARVSPKKAAATRRQLKRAAQKRGQTVSQARLALADWVIYITNVPVTLLNLEDVLVVVRVRWQIELLFKLWKNEGQLDKSRSNNSWRILCEIYAKLIALIIQHWLFLLGCWHLANRSLTKVAQTVRKFAFQLASVINNTRSLCKSLRTIQCCLASGCRMNARKTNPNTYQLLWNLADDA
jgi:hypothetical protein